MAINELVRLRTNLNSIDNEVNNNYLILLIYLLLSQILDPTLPEEPTDHDDVELQVTAGDGGQEAMPLTKELFQMDRNDVNFRKWSVEFNNRLEFLLKAIFVQEKHLSMVSIYLKV